MMEKILEKISMYEVFNSFLSGSLVCITIEYCLSIQIFSRGLIVSVVACYLLGQVATRLGSLVVEPLFESTKVIVKEPYSDYIEAEKEDEKISQLMMIANMYRSLVAALAVCLFVYLIGLLPFECINCIVAPIAIGALMILFAVSYKKQYSYVAKRVRANKDRKKHVGN